MEIKKEFQISQVSTWKYLLLLPIPILIATIASIYWHIIPENFSYAGSDSPMALTLLVLLFAFLGAGHWAIAKPVFESIIGYKEGAFSAMTAEVPDKEKFLAFAQKKIHRKTKFYLFVSSMMIFLVSCFLPFPTYEFGAVFIWIVMFALYFLWQYANQFDHIFGGLDPITKAQVVKAFGRAFYDKYFED